MKTRLLVVVTLWLSACGPTIGDPCTTDAECGPGVCLNRDFTPGGACSLACAVGGAACPSGTVCVRDALGKDRAGCLRSCAAQAECRGGYVCKVEKDSATPICVGPQGI